MEIKVYIRYLCSIMICLHIPHLMTDVAATCEDKIEVIYSMLSAEIAELKGKLLIEVMPDIERLKRSHCICTKPGSNDKNSTLDPYELYAQKIDDKIRAFERAFGNEKMERMSIAADLATMRENLETEKREQLHLITSNALSLDSNRFNIGEQSKEIKLIQEEMKEVYNATHYLSEKFTNDCQSSQLSCATKQKPFKQPSFISKWLPMKSQDDTLSECTIEHGLNKLPLKVEVQIKSVSVSASDWLFSGDSVFQSDDDTKEEYGGVVYLYNETHVLLKTPMKSNNEQAGKLMTTGAQRGRFINDNHFSFTEALVRVKIWLPEDFPDPEFNSGWLPLDVTDSKKAFYEVSHGLTQYPAFVNVQVRSAKGWISEGMGAVMSSPQAYANTGGVIYGYDDISVRIWAAFVPSERENPFGRLFGLADGWGTVTILPDNLKGEAKVTVWSPCSFSRDETPYEFAANVHDGDVSNAVLDNIDIDKDLMTFSVQALDGPNRGFLFKGYGSSQAQKEPFGGAIFAYNQEGKIKVWKPNERKNGHLIHINPPFGNGKLNQASNNAAYRIRVLRSNQR